ncbi:DNA topoisomerase III [Priestia megaterium]|nr:DNA topoisomerase III [Priestia megaterium]
MNPVLLCEKPAQARTYSECFEHKKHKDFIEIKPCEIFPHGAKVVWAIGHLAELAPPDKYKDEWKNWSLDTLPMIPENLNFKYVVSSQKKSHFKSVASHLKDSDLIIICTDPAAEGEAIARSIINLSGCSKKPLKRFWCSSMTPSAIKKAFANLKDAEPFEALFHQARARAYSDWIIGINSSRLYSLMINQKIKEKSSGPTEVYPTGRIQTPLLFLINHREEEISNFKPESFWEIYGEFNSQNGHYKGKLQIEKDNRFKDKNVAKATLQSLNGKTPIVNNLETKQHKNRAPKLHNLSSLQTKINKLYKISPSKTLEITQSLYEQAFVSYPRSEYTYLPEDEAQQLPSILNKLAELEPYKNLVRQKNKEDITTDKHFVDGEKVGDHFAIIITDKIPDLAKLSKEQQLVYDEIAKSTIAPFYDDHIYNQTTIITGVGEHNFKSTGKQIVNTGWKKIWHKENDKSEEKEEEQKLPLVNEGEKVALNRASIKEGVTKPPKPYTEGQLINLMRTAGSVKNTNVDLEDISQEELSKYGSLGTEATRSGTIDGLIKRKYIKVNKNIVEVTPKGKILMVAVKNTILSSAELTAKWEMYLQKIGEGQKKWQPFVEQSQVLIKKLIDNAMVNSKNWNLDHLINEIQVQDHIGKCPNCGKGIVDKKAFYGCTGYKEGCKFTLPKEILDKKISEANVKRLLEKGKSGVIKGLKGKKNPFDAHLVIKDPKEGKLEFEFPSKKATAKTK